MARNVSCVEAFKRWLTVAHIGALVCYPLVWSNRFAAKWRLLWSPLSGPNILITCSHSKISNSTFVWRAPFFITMLMRNIPCATKGLIWSYQGTQQWSPMTTLQLSDSSTIFLWSKKYLSLCLHPFLFFSDLYVNAVLGLMWTGVNIHGGYLN